MLSILRKNSKHWLVVGLMAIVAVGLTAFFGYSSRNAGGGQTWAAKVGGDTIKMGEYITRYRNVVEMYRKRLGPDFNEKMLEPLNIKFQILSSMVLDRIISTEANNNGLGVAKVELRDSIASIPYFQKDGKFSMDYYKGMLSYNRMSAHEFETIQKRDILREKMKNIIMTSSKVSDDELKAAYLVDNQKVRLSYMVVSEPTGAASSEVKKDEIKAYLASEEGKKDAQAYYTKHNNEFMDGKKNIIKFDVVKEDIAKSLLSRKKEEQSMGAKVEEALKTNDINKAAKILNSKVDGTDPFTRKAYSIPKMLGSNTNDVLWSFGLGSRMSRRDIGGKTYIVSARLVEGAKSGIPAKDYENFKKSYLAERGNAEFMNYVEELRKKWSKRVSYSPMIMNDIRQGSQE
jgi:hypothetical protein